MNPLNRKNVFLSTVIFAAVSLIAAFLLAKPIFLASSEKRKEHLARENARAINFALVTFSQRHMGLFPADEELTGLADSDILLKEKILRSYPVNPYSESGDFIKKAPFGEYSAGDFSYRRHPEKKFEYELIVYGGGGRVFERRFNEK